MLQAKDYFDLTRFDHADIFDPLAPPWLALTHLGDYLASLFEGYQGAKIEGHVSDHAVLHGDQIYIGPDAVIEDGVTIMAPAYIGAGCEVRQGAYIRGNALLGRQAVLGHASELKNSILMNEAKAPHFAYVGDSILGFGVNLGAGTKLSNLAVSSTKDQQTGKRPTIKIPTANGEIDTQLTKLGAIIGDHCETGCNSVLNPGAILGKSCWVYPNVSLPKGVVPANSIVKLRQTLQIIEKTK